MPLHLVVARVAILINGVEAELGRVCGARL